MAFIYNSIEEEDYQKWVEENGKFLKRFILENFTIQKPQYIKQVRQIYLNFNPCQQEG